LRSEQGRDFFGDTGRTCTGGVGRCQVGEASEGGGRSAKLSGDVKEMAETCARAEQGFAAGNRADEDDVGDGDGRLGEVAAGERSFMGGGQGEQAVEECVYPSRPGGSCRAAG